MFALPRFVSHYRRDRTGLSPLDLGWNVCFSEGSFSGSCWLVVSSTTKKRPMTLWASHWIVCLMRNGTERILGVAAYLDKSQIYMYFANWEKQSIFLKSF